MVKLNHSKKNLRQLQFKSSKETKIIHVPQALCKEGLTSDIFFFFFAQFTKNFAMLSCRHLFSPAKDLV